MTVVFIAGLFTGASIGIAIMCLMQVIKESEYADKEECEKQEK